MGIYKRSLLIVLSFITFYHLILVSLFNLYISNNLFPYAHKVNGNLHANKKVMKVAFKALFSALAKVRERFVFVTFILLVYLLFSLIYLIFFYLFYFISSHQTY